MEAGLSGSGVDSELESNFLQILYHSSRTDTTRFQHLAARQPTSIASAVVVKHHFTTVAAVVVVANTATASAPPCRYALQLCTCSALLLRARGAHDCGAPASDHNLSRFQKVFTNSSSSTTFGPSAPSRRAALVTRRRRVLHTTPHCATRPS